MMYLEGIVGWRCSICGSRNPSRRVICPCGESHRPVEEWLRREHELERALRETRFWLVFAVAAFVAAAGIAAAAWWVAFREVKATTDFHSSAPMGSDFSSSVSLLAGVNEQPAWVHVEKARGAAGAVPAGVEIFSDGREKAQNAQGGAA